MNLTSLGLKLTPPSDDDAQEESQDPVVQLSLRPELQRRQPLKVSHDDIENAALNIAESAMLVLQQYIPEFVNGNASLVNTISKVAGKFRSTRETSDYVNPLGLPCNPNDVRLCFPKNPPVVTTSTLRPLFDFRDPKSPPRPSSVKNHSKNQRSMVSSSGLKLTTPYTPYAPPMQNKEYLIRQAMKSLSPEHFDPATVPWQDNPTPQPYTQPHVSSRSMTPSQRDMENPLPTFTRGGVEPLKLAARLPTVSPYDGEYSHQGLSALHAEAATRADEVSITNLLRPAKNTLHLSLPTTFQITTTSTVIPWKTISQEDVKAVPPFAKNQKEANTPPTQAKTIDSSPSKDKFKLSDTLSLLSSVLAQSFRGSSKKVSYHTQDLLKRLLSF